MSADKKYWTVKEVSHEFNISTASIYKGIEKGEIPFIRILTNIRIPAWWVESKKPGYAVQPVEKWDEPRVPERVTIKSNGDVEADIDVSHFASRLPAHAQRLTEPDEIFVEPHEALNALLEDGRGYE